MRLNTDAFATIPVKLVSDSEDAEYGKHVRAIQAGRKAGRDTQSIAQEIDRMLYKHYELTDEEITTIEQNSGRE